MVNTRQILSDKILDLFRRRESCFYGNLGVGGWKNELKSLILPSIGVACDVKLNDFGMGVYFFNQGSHALAFFFFGMGGSWTGRSRGSR